MIYNDYEQKDKGLRAAPRQTCKKKKPPSPDKQEYIGGRDSYKKIQKSILFLTKKERQTPFLLIFYIL